MVIYLIAVIVPLISTAARAEDKTGWATSFGIGGSMIRDTDGDDTFRANEFAYNWGPEYRYSERWALGVDFFGIGSGTDDFNGGRNHHRCRRIRAPRPIHHAAVRRCRDVRPAGLRRVFRGSRPPAVTPRARAPSRSVSASTSVGASTGRFVSTAGICRARATNPVRSSPPASTTASDYGAAGVFRNLDQQIKFGLQLLIARGPDHMYKDSFGSFLQRRSLRMGADVVYRNRRHSRGADLALAVHAPFRARVADDQGRARANLEGTDRPGVLRRLESAARVGRRGVRARDHTRGRDAEPGSQPLRPHAQSGARRSQAADQSGRRRTRRAGLRSHLAARSRRGRNEGDTAGGIPGHRRPVSRRRLDCGSPSPRAHPAARPDRVGHRRCVGRRSETKPPASGNRELATILKMNRWADRRSSFFAGSTVQWKLFLRSLPCKRHWSSRCSGKSRRSKKQLATTDPPPSFRRWVRELNSGRVSTRTRRLSRWAKLQSARLSARN